jgi:hypothetical protein
MIEHLARTTSFCSQPVCLVIDGGLFFSMYSAAVENISIAQAAMAVTTVNPMLFSGSLCSLT